jgi:glycosyltransferase involved in cell wall biosynthesis
MPETLPISVQVLTFNSGATLEQALESVGGCKEILVIDGGSADTTRAIAEKFVARILPQHAQGKTGAIQDFSEVRNIGLQQGTQPWILALDSDETVSKEMMSELLQAVKSERVCAYYIPRRYVTCDGVVIQQASTYPNERVYFFHRDAVTKWIKPVHERVEVKPGAETKHFSGGTLAPLPTIEEYKKKNLQYILLEAARTKGKGWGFWLRHIVWRSLRSRAIATIRLANIWLVPRPGARLPLRHEALRFWYAWQLVRYTCPAKNRAPAVRI